MKIALLSYQMLFQRKGGLQIHVLETLKSLNKIGIKADLFDPATQKLSDYDLIHVFSSINGNNRIVEAAKEQNVPVVITPIIQTSDWTRWFSVKAAIIDKIVGKMSDWNLHTNYHEIKSAITKADHVFAGSLKEKRVIENTFEVKRNNISIVPIGVSDLFFSAEPSIFRKTHNYQNKFVLCAANISPYKNQLSIIKALKNSDLDVVLLGGIEEKHKKYLDECLGEGGARVHYFGNYEHDNPILTSAYAAAEVSILISQGENGPTVTYESLASGTPAVVTKYNGLDLEKNNQAWMEVDPSDLGEICTAVESLRKDLGAEIKLNKIVKEYAWSNVALQINEVYGRLVRDAVYER